jgi:3-oxoacyl-[acyl-carrier-protein] synthase II
MRDQTAGSGRRRVVVSGLGAVSGLGWGAGPLWEGLRAGRTGIRPFERFDHSGHRTHLAAEVPPPADSPGMAVLERRFPGWRRLSLADRYALFATAEALAQAGIDGELADAEAGVYFGSSTGGMFESELFFADFLRDRRKARLSALVAQQVNAPGDAVARWLGITGPVQTISSACASGALALGTALEALRTGEVDLAIAGGSDSLCQLTYAGFNALRSVDAGPCRPFRAAREGMSFGEGAAVTILEPLERVLARRARPLAELVGAGASCDAHHMTAPEPGGTGAAAALAAALCDARVAPEAVDFVNAHATGTPLNDSAEWQALCRVFGERAADLPVTASKALIGHLLGSSGAIEAVVTILSLLHGELHPVPEFGEEQVENREIGENRGMDPDLPVALVLDRPLPLPGARTAVSTSLAFGGSNAALVFSRWTDQAA